MTRRIAISGDWHGNGDFAEDVIDYVSSLRLTQFHHAGDFGIWPGVAGWRYREQVDHALAQHEMHLIVTLGNHDDWSQVEDLLAPDMYVRLPGTNQIWLAPRVGVVSGIAHVSGAVSVDQGIRTKGVDWWPQEALTSADLYMAEEFRATTVKLVVSHDCPASAPVPVMPNPPKFWEPYLGLSQLNRERLEEIVGIMIGDQEPVLACGHYHKRCTFENVELKNGGRLSRVEVLGADLGDVEDNVIVVEIE